MKDNAALTSLHQKAVDQISDILISLQDETLAEVGEIPRRFKDWGEDDGVVLWWDVSMTGGEIAEPPSYVGSPSCSDWVYAEHEHGDLLWVPLPKLARGRP